MKKPLIIALTLSLLFCLCLPAAAVGDGSAPSYAAAAPGSAGTPSDPLITKSYADGTYSDYALKTALEKQSAAIAALNHRISAVLGINTGSFSVQTIHPGGSVTMTLGGSVTLTRGSALMNISSGQVINVTTGVIAKTGSQLTLNNRYLAAENSAVTITFLSESVCAIDGGAKVASTGSLTVTFTDVPSNHWAYQYVSALAAMGAVNGEGDGRFNPSANITRADFVTILGRVSGVDPADYIGASFSDVSATSYYAPHVKWAYENGLVTGYDGGVFMPGAKITRQEMAVIVVRYAAYCGKALPSSSAQPKFADDGKIAGWAAAAVASAQASGIINGKENNLFDPAGNATRAEICAVILRLISL